MRRRIASLVAAFALLGASFATTADDPDEACFRSKTNAARPKDERLADDARIDRVAREHSANMAEDETIYHNPDLAGDYERAAGGYEYGGENVGMGESCEKVFDAFMASPGHRDNILAREYTHLGVGVTKRDDTLYVTLDFFTPERRARPPAKRPPPPEECR